MLRQLSETLGIQIVLVSHSDAIIEQADRAYRIRLENGVSKVERIEGG
jgi:chromosome segregation ATPase